MVLTKTCSLVKYLICCTPLAAPGLFAYCHRLIITFATHRNRSYSNISKRILFGPSITRIFPVLRLFQGKYDHLCRRVHGDGIVSPGGNNHRGYGEKGLRPLPQRQQQNPIGRNPKQQLFEHWHSMLASIPTPNLLRFFGLSKTSHDKCASFRKQSCFNSGWSQEPSSAPTSNVETHRAHQEISILSNLFRARGSFLSWSNTDHKVQPPLMKDLGRIRINSHKPGTCATFPLLLVIFATLPLLVQSRKVGVQERQETHTTWQYVCPFLVGFLIRRIPISFVAFIAALTYTWSVIQLARPADEPIKSTFQHTPSSIVLGGLFLANLIFMALHLVSLAGFRGQRRRREISLVRRAHWTALQTQDMYVLRVITVTMILFVGLLAKSRENFTPHMALTWVPVFWSISTLINAGWRRDESPLDVEVGPESDE